MEETSELIICGKCGSNACAKTVVSETNIFLCFGCGFTASTALDEKVYEENLPQLYKDLKFRDKEGLAWYPMTVSIPGKGLVFLDGDKWNAVKSGTNMAEPKKFGIGDFMEALDHIDYFK